MKKILLVLRYELITTLKRRSYLLLSFGFPILGLIVFAVISIVRGDNGKVTTLVNEISAGDLAVEGYVDQAGIIDVLPDDLPPGILKRYPSEAAAFQATEAGEIEAYYVIPQDYIETGSLIYVHPTITPMSSGGQEWTIGRTITLNLLEGDTALTEKFWNPMDLEVTNLSPEPSYDRYAAEDCTTPGPACQSSVLVRYIPFIMVVMFFVFLTQGAGLLLRNVTTEKQNHVIEILMLSVTPKQLMAGKLIGLGLASLLSTLTWLITGFTILRSGRGLLNLPSELSIPPTMLLWSLLFFLLGYALYASLMAGAGSLVPNLKEVTQATWAVITPLFAAYIVGLMASGEAPHGPLSTALSMFPLTAPIMMSMRLTVGGVPLWQVLTSLALLLLTTVLVIRAVAGFFHAQTLLSGQSFSARRFFNALLGRPI
jgi:ABC-2 type transport system permease protein